MVTWQVVWRVVRGAPIGAGPDSVSKKGVRGSWRSEDQVTRVLPGLCEGFCLCCRKMVRAPGIYFKMDEPVTKLFSFDSKLILLTLTLWFWRWDSANHTSFCELLLVPFCQPEVGVGACRKEGGRRDLPLPVCSWWAPCSHYCFLEPVGAGPFLSELSSAFSSPELASAQTLRHTSTCQSAPRLRGLN